MMLYETFSMMLYETRFYDAMPDSQAIQYVVDFMRAMQRRKATRFRSKGAMPLYHEGIPSRHN
jgi:hypothetical protein